ncbi:restriction endonuclease subunit S [Halomonas sp. HK25]|uniref:restriction endonuclease subunit S n=1 Tax=Halomonas sp. HK25 TaxID=3394321 RepID=UPI0039FC9179
MREGWKSAKLGEVSEMIKRGIAPKYTDAGGVCVINQKCVRDHSINYALARRHDVDAKKVPQERLIQLGDVLVNSTGTGTLGRVAQVRSEPSESATVDTHVTIVRPADGLFYHDFFGYMLIKIEDEIISSGEGASGQTELPRQKLESQFLVSFPESIEEQKRIVAILDEAFEGIDTVVANTEKNLANARELFESYLNSGFSHRGVGWNNKKLSDLGNITSSKRIFKSEYTESGVPFFRTKEIKELAHGQAISKPLFISKKRYVEIKSKHGVPEVDDILITAIGTIGEVYVVDNNDEFYFKDGNVLWLKDFKNINSSFLKYALICFVENLKRISRGSAYNALPIEKLKQYEVPVPSCDEQEKLSSTFDELSHEAQRLEFIYQQKLAALAELKQSLLQKAFSGELTAREAETAVEEAIG